MPELAWAWNSSVACFVEPEAEFFRGLHQFFRTELPAYSTIVITLIPEDKSQDLSIYAYSGSGEYLPPNLPTCVSCEADHRRDKPRIYGRRIPNHARQIELRAVRNPSPVTIGISGPAGQTAGKYTLKIWVKPRN